MNYESQIQIKFEGEMALTLRHRYQSGQWWFFLPVGSRGIAELTAIEQRFYQPGTTLNDDFETAVRLSPYGLFGLGLGHKRRLPRRKLEKFLRRRGAKIEAIGREQDILMLGDGSIDGSAAMTLLNWLLTAKIINPSLN